MAEAFQKSAAGDKVQFESIQYPENPEELLDLSTRAAENGFDAVFLAVHRLPAVYLIQALNRAGLKAAFLGTHSVAVTDVVPLFDQLAAKAYVSLPFDSFEPDERGRAFVGDYMTRYQDRPNWLASQGFDAVKLAAETLIRIGDDPAEVKAALDSIDSDAHAFQGISGRYYFDAGASRRPVYVVPADSGLLGRVP